MKYTCKILDAKVSKLKQLEPFPIEDRDGKIRNSI